MVIVMVEVSKLTLIKCKAILLGSGTDPEVIVVVHGCMLVHS